MSKLVIKAISAEDTWPIRQRVMWPDRPLSYVQLADDKQGLHYGGFIEGKLVSVISLFIRADRAQFRKFATEVDEQGKGYGSELLRHVLQQARQAGVRELWCNARMAKARYYEQFGLAKTSKTFEKGGVAYVVMEMAL